MSNLDYYDGGRLIRVPVAPSLPDGAITAADVEDPTVDCPNCEGRGEVADYYNGYIGTWETKQCRACDGMGEVTPDEALDITERMTEEPS